MEPADDRAQRPEMPDEPPPFLGRWSRVYALVVGYLGLLIVIFYLFEAAFTQ